MDRLDICLVDLYKPWVSIVGLVDLDHNFFAIGQSNNVPIPGCRTLWNRKGGRSGTAGSGCQWGDAAASEKGIGCIDSAVGRQVELSCWWIYRSSSLIFGCIGYGDALPCAFISSSFAAVSSSLQLKVLQIRMTKDNTINIFLISPLFYSDI